MINFKKVYRLCKELVILKPQRKVKPREIKHIAINRTVIKSNSLWEMDIKYGYIQGEDRFFFVLPIINSFNKILEYECFQFHEFENYTQAYNAVDSFINHYNQIRIHSSLKYRTSDEFYILAKNQEVDDMIIKTKVSIF